MSNEIFNGFFVKPVALCGSTLNCLDGVKDEAKMKIVNRDDEIFSDSG